MAHDIHFPGASTLFDSIGNTPLVRLERICPESPAIILAKVEFLNPSGSIKDRIVRHIIDDAEATGMLVPGATIVENTSGNTGAAIAMIAAARGYKAILTMPDKVSKEKQDALLAYGAEIVMCPTDAMPGSSAHYVQRAKEIAGAINGSFMINQYDNLKNVEAHYCTTAREIWTQTGGNIDYFVASGSTGGTVTGVSRFLKERNKSIKVVLPDPVGSIFHGYFNNGTVEMRDVGVYQVEGVGEDHLTGCMDFSAIDETLQFCDDDAFQAARLLAKTEGILAGGSSGANIWGCLRVARRLKERAIIVTVLPDTGLKYLSKIYA